MKRFLLSLVALCFLVSTGHAIDLPTWSWKYPWNGGGAATDKLTFYSSLSDTDSILTPSRAAAGTTATFSRASAAYITDYQGQIRKVESGSVAVEGSRVVTNLLTYSEDLSQATWSVGGATKTATTVTITGAGGTLQNLATPLIPGGTYTLSVVLSVNSGTATTCLTGNDTANWGTFSQDKIVTVTTTPKRFSVTGVYTPISGNSFYFKIGDKTKSGASAGTSLTTFNVSSVQIENVTAQQPLPGEYVKTVASPVTKCFATTNGNTVDGNGVVTEGTGTALPTSYPEWTAQKQYSINDRIQVAGWWYYATNVSGPSGAVAPTWLTGSVRYTPITISDGSMVWTLGGRLLLGYVSEGSSSNKTTAYGLIPADTLGSELITVQADREFSSVTGNWSLDVWSIGGGVCSINSGANALASIYVGFVPGKKYQITFTVKNYVSGAVQISDSTGAYQGTARTANGTYTETILISNGANGSIYFGLPTGFNGAIDDVSVKEVTWATGTKSFHNGSSFVNNISGLTLSGDPAATLEIVTDQSAIEQAGLAGINPGYKVYKLDNSGGTGSAYAAPSGTTGNTNPHSLSVLIRANGTGTVGLDDNAYAAPVTTTSTTYIKLKKENHTPGASTRTMMVQAGSTRIAYFLLPQLEEASFVSSLMPTSGSTATRAATSLSYPTGATIKTNKCTNYNVVPADSLGAELITVAADRDFSSDTGWWGKTAAWSISGGTLNAVAAGDTDATYKYIMIPGRVYQITYTVSSVTSGSMKVRAGDTSGPLRSSTGTYTETLLCTGDGGFRIYGTNSAFTGSIDNVSVKEVTWAVGTKSYWTGAAFTQNITGLTLSGDQAAVLSIVDDTTALTAAGLMGYATTGKVYKLDNSAGSTSAAIVVSGTAGNTNAHSLSAYVRSGTDAQIHFDWSDAPSWISTSSQTYIRIKKENTIPSSTGRSVGFFVHAGEIVYFLLNQLEESATANPDPIITQGAVGYKSYGGTNLRGNDVTVGIEGTPYTIGTFRMMETNLDSVNRWLYYITATTTVFERASLGLWLNSNLAVTFSANSTYRNIGLTSSQTGATSYVNGTKGSVEATFKSFPVGSTFSVGSGIGGSLVFPGYIRNLRIYFKPLSDAKCISLTQ